MIRRIVAPPHSKGDTYISPGQRKRSARRSADGEAMAKSDGIAEVEQIVQRNRGVQVRLKVYR